jgi:hypothetical protein
VLCEGTTHLGCQSELRRNSRQILCRTPGFGVDVVSYGVLMRDFEAMSTDPETTVLLTVLCDGFEG